MQSTKHTSGHAVGDDDAVGCRAALNIHPYPGDTALKVFVCFAPRGAEEPRISILSGQSPWPLGVNIVFRQTFPFTNAEFHQSRVEPYFIPQTGGFHQVFCGFPNSAEGAGQNRHIFGINPLHERMAKSLRL